MCRGKTKTMCNIRLRDEEGTYLLYKTISGSHMCSDGTYSSVTPPYSDGSHWSL